MATYSIYGYDNGDDNPPLVTVVLSDDDSEILEVIPRIQDDDYDDIEDVLKDYIDRGATALEALKLYTHTYGSLEKVGHNE